MPDGEGATIHVLNWNLVVLGFLPQIGNALKNFVINVEMCSYIVLIVPSQHQHSSFLWSLLKFALNSVLIVPSQRRHSSFAQRFSALAPPGPEQTFDCDILFSVTGIVLVSQIKKGTLYPPIMHKNVIIPSSALHITHAEIQPNHQLCEEVQTLQRKTVRREMFCFLVEKGELN